MLFDQRAGMRLMSATHEFWYRLTNGLIGGNVLGAKILLLTTTGRKSGKRYTTPLLYVEDGDDIVVIASNNGSDRDPDWWRNLLAHPEATAQVGGRFLDVRAEKATGAERERIWTKIKSRHSVYRDYERRTTREIPVVLLHPQ
jgi:deazaflavin-dependent oxidoreductase (nitroreductase family)